MGKTLATFNKDYYYKHAREILSQWLIREESAKGKDFKRAINESVKFKELVLSTKEQNLKNSFFDLIEDAAKAQGLNGKDVSWQVRNEFVRIFQEKHYKVKNHDNLSQRLVLVGVPLYGEIEKFKEVSVEFMNLFTKSGMVSNNTPNRVGFIGILDSEKALKLSQDFSTMQNFRSEFGSFPSSEFKKYKSLENYIPDFIPNNSHMLPNVVIFAIQSVFHEDMDGDIFAFDEDLYIDDVYEKVSSSWEKELKKFLKNKDNSTKELLENVFPTSLFNASIFAFKMGIEVSYYDYYCSKTGEKTSPSFLKELFFLDKKTNQNAIVAFLDDKKLPFIESGLRSMPASGVLMLSELDEFSEVHDYSKKDEVIKLYMEKFKKLSSSSLKSSKRLH